MSLLAKLHIARPAADLRVVDVLDDYALVLAHVRHFDDESAVLEALGVSEADWLSAHRWANRMATAAFRGDRTLMGSFATTFRAELERLRQSDDASSAGFADADTALPLVDAPAHPGMTVLAASNAAAQNPLPGGAADGDAAPASSPLSTRDLSFIAPRPALPFDPNARPTLADRADSPAATPSTAEDELLERTLSIEVHRPPNVVLPFVPAPTMSVDQYASMRASLAVFPEKRDVILARYGIGGDAHLAGVARAFTAAFAQDPDLQEAFVRRFDEIRVRLEPSTPSTRRSDGSHES